MIKIFYIPPEKIKPYIPYLKKIDQTCFGKDCSYDFELGSEGSKAGTHHWWICQDTETKKYIGYAGIKIYKDKPHAFLCRAGVLALYRGQGIHKKLIKKRIFFCQKNKIKKILSYTSYCNFPSANNLIENGFILRWPWFETEDPRDFIYFEKYL